MSTYNTYQEAKIANPESEIVRWNKSDEYKAVSKSDLSGYLTTWSYCSPADYCMTVEQFLKDGHKFVDREVYLNQFGQVIEIGRKYGDIVITPKEANIKTNVDNECYILRAAALEQPKQEVEQPKRTKVEYVRVEYSQAWEVVKIHEEGAELFKNKSDKFPISRINSIALRAQSGYPFYRKVVTELTERELVIEKAMEVAKEADTEDDKIFLGKLYDLGMLKPIKEG